MARFLEIEPSELKFAYCKCEVELNKQCNCSITLTNKSQQNIAFKVKTTHPERHCVRPNVGAISPGSCCVVEVRRITKNVEPVGMLKERLLIQTIAAKNGENFGEVTSEMFRGCPEDEIQSYKLRVVVVGANSPQGSSQEASEVQNVDFLNCWRSLLNNVAKVIVDCQRKLYEAFVFAGDSNESDRIRNHRDGISQPQFRPENNHTGIMENKNSGDLETGVVCQDTKLEKMPMKQEEEGSKHNKQQCYGILLLIILSFLLGYLMAIMLWVKRLS